jgi:hypothetical protein
MKEKKTYQWPKRRVLCRLGPSSLSLAPPTVVLYPGPSLAAAVSTVAGIDGGGGGVKLVVVNVVVEMET